MKGLFLFSLLFFIFALPSSARALEVDLGTDGVAEVITGAGADSEPFVTVARRDGSIIGSFLAYDLGMRDGVTVAACDLTGDGVAEIVTGTQFGGGPHVRVFTNYGKPTGVQFMAYDSAFFGGVFVACGDANSDGVNEIITGAGASGGPHVRWFNGQGELMNEYFSGSADDPRGVKVWFANGQLQVAPSDPVVTPIESDVIVVDRSRQLLTYYVHGYPVKRFSVSTGRRFFETPLGETTVTKKLPIHDYYWPGAYFLKDVKWNLQFRPHLYIHTAYWHNKFGTPMSSGCVNMRESEAQWLYERVDVGTPVRIIE